MQHRRREEIGCKIRSLDAKEEACSRMREKVLNALDKLPWFARSLIDAKRELIIDSSLLVFVSRTKSLDGHGMDGLSHCLIACFHFLGMNFWICDIESPLKINRDGEDGIHYVIAWSVRKDRIASPTFATCGLRKLATK